MKFRCNIFLFYFLVGVALAPIVGCEILGGDREPHFRWELVNSSFQAELFSDGRTLLAAERGALLKSTDGGVTWDTTLAADPDVRGGYFFATDGAQTIYASGGVAHPDPVDYWLTSRYESRLYRSEDGGATWELVLWNPEWVGEAFFGRVAAHGEFLCVLAHSRFSDVWAACSLDGGRTWVRTPFASPNPVELFLATEVGSLLLDSRLLRDGGRTSVEFQGDPISHAMAVRPGRPNEVWGVVGQWSPADGQFVGVARSEDGGATWTRVAIPFRRPITALVVDAAGQAYAAVQFDHVYRSLDGGKNWEVVDEGLPKSPASGSVDVEVRQLVLGPEGRLFARTSAGLYRTGPAVSE